MSQKPLQVVVIQKDPPLTTAGRTGRPRSGSRTPTLASASTTGLARPGGVTLGGDLLLVAEKLDLSGGEAQMCIGDGLREGHGSCTC